MSFREPVSRRRRRRRSRRRRSRRRRRAGGFGQSVRAFFARERWRSVAGKQSLMTSVFGGGFVGGVRRDMSVSSESPASKNGRARAPRRGGGAGLVSYASPSDASVADLAADGWDLRNTRRAPPRMREGLGLRAKKNAGEPAMLPPPPSAPEDVEHWTGRCTPAEGGARLFVAFFHDCGAF